MKEHMDQNKVRSNLLGQLVEKMEQEDLDVTPNFNTFSRELQQGVKQVYTQTKRRKNLVKTVTGDRGWLEVGGWW